jgi:hypothetical protein
MTIILVRARPMACLDVSRPGIVLALAIHYTKTDYGT